MLRNREVYRRALLYIVVMVLQMYHQIRKCELSLRGGCIGVFLENNTLCWKGNSFIHSSAKGHLHDMG